MNLRREEKRRLPQAAGGSRPSFLLAAMVALTLVLCLTATVAAQGMIEGEARIGVILPAQVDQADSVASAMVRAAHQGAAMAADELQFNAEMLGIDFAVVTADASGADAVVAAADTLLAEHAIFGLVGAFAADEAVALAAWSVETGVPFVNVGASADALRSEYCAATVFHIEPSAAMYLDSMAGWYVRSGFRNWYLVVAADAESQAQRDRAATSLRERHFGARIVGETTIDDSSDMSAVAAAVRRASADLVVLLLPAEEQLAALSALEQEGLSVQVTGFPYPEAQTRTFYAASRTAAPTLGTGHRISAWEATLDAYGARELNARYRAFYGEPMDDSAWAVYQGVKVLYEGAFFGGTTDVESATAYLNSPQSVFDVWKGIGTSFRAWDGQLRQSLYLAKIDAASQDAFTLASLVGELPAIYMPGTDPVERLDQIGVIGGSRSCTR